MNRTLFVDSELIELRDESYNLLVLDLLSAFRFLKGANIGGRCKGIAMELMCTFLMALFLKKCGGSIYGVGIPCRKGRIEGLSKLDMAVLKKLSVECSDIDTMIVLNKEDDAIKYFSIQVVRYTYQKNASTDDLLSFLKRKKLAKYNNSKGLHLIVNLEHGFRLEYERLGSCLVQARVPFASIFAIGHLGDNDSLQFTSVRLFPIVEGPITLDLRKPPPG